MTSVAGMYGVRWSAHDLRWVAPCHFAAGAVVFFWLSWLVISRTSLDRVSQGSRLCQRGAVVICGAMSMCATALAPSTIGQRGALAMSGCTLAWLALEVCRAHGVSPLTRFPTSAADRLRDWRIAGAVVLTCVAGGDLANLLTVLLGWADIAGVPSLEGSQLGALGISTFAQATTTVVWAVAIEDVVMVAATTTLLTAIRRPTPEIYTLVCLIQVLVHAYLGLPAIGMAVYALGRIWLYRRYQRLLPLAAGHAAIDLTSATARLLPGLYQLLPPVLLTITVVWISSHLKEAAARQCADRHVKQEPAPAGPSGSATDTAPPQDRPTSTVT
ncbi:hypothetical protein [Streptomyces sp. NPDC091215]|uniref:hypothetical protein n=1 Tax=Streptomyces sp. NPDC091215 TaxID=3155192 RepID=UPI00342CFD95